MIGSIGYQRLTLEKFLLAVHAADVVIDVRAKPVSRIKGFGKNQLSAALGSRYEWHGDKLPGHGAVIPQSSLEWLVKRSKGINAVLLCMEEAPGDCHRHQTIARPLIDMGVDVRHRFQDEIVLASDLQSAIDGGEDSEYDCYDASEWWDELSIARVA